MDGKIKVYNPTQHDVGVYLLDNPLNGRNIRPGAFLFMTEADVEMLLATTKLFSDGHLKVEEKAEQLLADNGIELQDNPNLMSDEEIKKKLSMSAKKIGECFKQGKKDEAEAAKARATELKNIIKDGEDQFQALDKELNEFRAQRMAK